MKQKRPVFVTDFNPLSMVIAAIIGSTVLPEQLNLGRFLGEVVILAGLYLLIWGNRNDVNQSDTKGEGDQFPSANQQIPPSNETSKNDPDILLIAIPPTNEMVKKVNEMVLSLHITHACCFNGFY